MGVVAIHNAAAKNSHKDEEHPPRLLVRRDFSIFGNFGNVTGSGAADPTGTAPVSMVTGPAPVSMVTGAAPIPMSTGSAPVST